MARTQVNTRVSEAVKERITWLMNERGYSLRDIISIGVNRLFLEENEMGKHIEVVNSTKADHPVEKRRILADGFSNWLEMVNWMYDNGYEQEAGVHTGQDDDRGYYVYTLKE